LRKIGKPLKKAESHRRKWKAVEESRNPIGENWILGEGNLNIGKRFHNISKRFSSIGDSFPTCNW
jgi:hypothetical protein